MITMTGQAPPQRLLMANERAAAPPLCPAKAGALACQVDLRLALNP